MHTNPTVTALVPAYQAAEFIQPTLDSLSAQTRDGFDVIVSVDLCDDDTYEICMKHSAQDPRFRVIKQDQRMGYVGNCNFLINHASADYVLLAFHDDLLEPGYVEKLCLALDTHPEAVLSFSDVLYTAVDGSQEHWTYTELDGIHDRVQRGMKMLNRGDSRWYVPNRGIFRLKEARKIQGIKTHGAGEFSVDWPWLFHMSLLGEFVRVDEILCKKFRKPGSLSRTWAFSMEQQFEVSAACMREIWISELSTDEKLKLAIPLANGLVKYRQKQHALRHHNRVTAKNVG